MLGENIPHVPGAHLAILFQGEVPGIQKMELNGVQIPLVRVTATFVAVKPFREPTKAGGIAFPCDLFRLRRS